MIFCMKVTCGNQLQLNLIGPLRQHVWMKMILAPLRAQNFVPHIHCHPIVCINRTPRNTCHTFVLKCVTVHNVNYKNMLLPHNVLENLH